jgi:2-polyprenyl-6-methoxyphenol hydroxylase-like FAD-dependent oxidoreductase
VFPYLGYATRLFEKVSLDEPIRAAVLLADSGGLPRGGVMFPIEGGRHIVTLYGFSRDYPPTDEAGFLSYALSLRAPLIHNAIRHASPASPIHAFQKNEARFSRYGSAARWPMNFLVTGDAVASFNPIYGQGMTAALLAGEALRTALEAVEGEGRADALAIQRRITAAYRVPWQIARSEDLRWPATKWDGLRWPVRLEHRLGNMIGRAAACDPVVTQAYIEVLHLLRPPGSLVRPSMLWRILLHSH